MDWNKVDLVAVVIRKERGLATRIARELGITREAVWLWKRVPSERVLVVEKVTGIPRHLIRPDLYPRPPS